jgi:hypothetical protein
MDRLSVRLGFILESADQRRVSVASSAATSAIAAHRLAEFQLSAFLARWIVAAERT